MKNVYNDSMLLCDGMYIYNNCKQGFIFWVKMKTNENENAAMLILYWSVGLIQRKAQKKSQLSGVYNIYQQQQVNEADIFIFYQKKKKTTTLQSVYQSDQSAQNSRANELMYGGLSFSYSLSTESTTVKAKFIKKKKKL